MDKPGFEHSEAFLQWIWQNLLFDLSGLETTCGKSVRIINPGRQNETDGPDFNHAAISINEVTWHGDVELHLKEEGWKAHGHHTDPNYNAVVLHVFLDDAETDIYTQNEHRPFGLNLRPHLPQKLHRFLGSFDKPHLLNCATGLRFVSEEAFYNQLEKAHKEYFEQKSDDFLQFYDPEKLPTQAWKHALIISLWDGLGISHNREPMRQTAALWIKEFEQRNDTPSLNKTLKLAGVKTADTNSDIRWNYKSVRPSSHPKKRVAEAVRISDTLMQLPFNDFLTPDAIRLWKQILEASSLRNTGRYQILFGTVFLPALYMLGSLFAYQSLSEAAFNAWKDLKTPIPSSLVKAFSPLSLGNKSYQKKLGAIHQLRAYCKPSKCSECFVLKKAIQS